MDGRSARFFLFERKDPLNLPNVEVLFCFADPCPFKGIACEFMQMLPGDRKMFDQSPVVVIDVPAEIRRIIRVNGYL
jgi:hypothetical protein